MKKRFLSTLMALCLALSMLPTAAFADEGGGLDGPQMDIQQTQQDATSDGNPSASDEDTGNGPEDSSQSQPNQGITTPEELGAAIEAAGGGGGDHHHSGGGHQTVRPAVHLGGEGDYPGFEREDPVHFHY